MSGEWSDGASSPLEPGDPHRVGTYEILARLGAGGMATVYLGRDGGAGGDRRLVAVKLVHPHLAADSEFRARFVREERAGRRVPAFCSARVLDSGEHDGRPYLVTEYIAGVPLSRLVADDGPLDLPRLHALALGTASGLAAIHGAGLVHRDVKPSNVIMTLGGVRIIDFGIARSLDDTTDHTRSGVVMGSLGWVAPEQLEGAAPDPAMDVFGWGCVIGFAATGDHPFGGTDVSNRAWRVLGGEPALGGVPEPLRPLVASALRRSPQQRPTMRELLFALFDTVTPAASPTVGRRAAHRAVGVLAAAPLVLALVGAVGVAHIGGDAARPGDAGTPAPTVPVGTTRHPTTSTVPGQGDGTGTDRGPGGTRAPGGGTRAPGGGTRAPGTSPAVSVPVTEAATAPQTSGDPQPTKKVKPSKTKKTKEAPPGT